MTRYARGYRIQGHSMNTYSGTEPQERDEPADRQTVVYDCPGGHQTPVPFAAAAVPPEAWDCRQCGKAAHREGAPADAVPVTPKYGPHEWQLKGTRHGDDITPMGQLMKRRTTADLERLLAERIAELREGAA